MIFKHLGMINMHDKKKRQRPWAALQQGQPQFSRRQLCSRVNHKSGRAGARPALTALEWKGL